MRARNYRKIKGQPYTRKKFIRGAPPPKISKFTMGDPSGNFGYQVSLIADKETQVRHNALEAARVAVNRVLSEKLGQNFRLRVLPYPHHVLRENKMLFTTHADRFQDGMRGAFGKPIGTAARVKLNQSIIAVDVDEEGLEVAKEALKRGEAKLPVTCRVIVTKCG